MPGYWLIEQVIDIGLLRDLGLRSRYPQLEYCMLVQWLLAGLIVGAVVRHKDVATRIGMHIKRTPTSTPVAEPPHAQRQRVLSIIGRCLLIALIVIFFSWNRMVDRMVDRVERFISNANASRSGIGYVTVSDSTCNQEAQDGFIRAVCDSHVQEWKWVIFVVFCILAAVVARRARLTALEPETRPGTTGAVSTLAMIVVILLLLHPWYQ